MEKLSYSQIQAELGSDSLLSLEPLRLAILRSIVVESIEPYLRYMAYQMGFNASCQFGEYDNVLQEAVGLNKSLLNEETACVLVFLRLESLSSELSRNFPALKADQVKAEKERIKDFITKVLTGIRMQTPATILWPAFELPIHPALGITDSQRSDGQTALVLELNEFLQDSLCRLPNAYFVDLNLCVARIGATRFYDSRYWHIARAPYSREAMQEIASEVFKYIRALKGKNKKCLALDCDNVLWGGTIGEDGLAGIRLGKDYPGSPYYEFQQEVLGLYNRGIIIALCSKNNEEDVWEVFHRHPDMLLRREHISAAQINWRDKATNLRQIASDLNIGLDSVVFADDSDFEVNLIRQALPEVEVLQLPQGRAVEYREILASCGLFDALTLSEEDSARGLMYRAEGDRKSLRAQSCDLESYLASLEMVLEVRFADEISIPRIAQLTQKTNQFNLTTRRYSDAHIRRFVDRESADVVCVRLRDRFGDSGIVGVCIIEYEAGEAVFDSLLLSCRVLGRGVEDAFLTQCLKLVELRGCSVAIGEYRAAAKNVQAKDFYLKNGFTLAAENDHVHRFAMDLAEFDKREPQFFKRIDSDLDSKLGERLEELKKWQTG